MVSDALSHTLFVAVADIHPGAKGYFTFIFRFNSNSSVANHFLLSVYKCGFMYAEGDGMGWGVGMCVCGWILLFYTKNKK